MLVVASAVEPRSAEKWLKQSSRVERRRDFVVAVSSSFQKLLLLIRRVRRLSGVALSGFPAAEPLLGPISPYSGREACAKLSSGKPGRTTLSLGDAKNPSALSL